MTDQMKSFLAIYYKQKLLKCLIEKAPAVLYFRGFCLLDTKLPILSDYFFVAFITPLK
jgi:hypothetical protein